MIKAEEKITLVRVDDGEGGKSAYQAAVEAGYTGTEEQFNLDLVEVPNKASITQVTMIQERVNSVEGIVDTLETNVGDLGTRITTIQGKVEQAEQDIAEITISAEQAKTDAQAANQSATEAKTAATEAKTSATEAKTSAQQAIADAATAQTAAETAQSNANTALTKAEQAITDAQSANQAAQQAKQSAESAKTDAETAKSSAQSAIESAAGAALAAQTAQDAAQAAKGELDLQKSYFWHDDNGSHVLSAENGFQSNMQSIGMGVVDLRSGQEVAFFGVEDTTTRTPMVRIGRDDYTHLELTDRTASYWYDNTNKFLEFGRAGSAGNYHPFFTFGSRTTTGTIGAHSSVFGYDSEASGDYSLAIGMGNIVQGNYSVAAGWSNTITSTGVSSFACGYDSTVSAGNAFAGGGATASGEQSFAFGANSEAKGANSVVFGDYSIAKGDYGVALGRGLIADSNQLVIGKYNKTNSNHAFIIGNGTGDTTTNRRTVFYVSDGGDVYADGYITAVNMPSLPLAPGSYVLVGKKTASGQKGTFTWQNQILACNPVGVVIMTNNSENPATAYGGGTWNQLGTKTVGTKTIYYWERTK